MPSHTQPAKHVLHAVCACRIASPADEYCAFRAQNLIGQKTTPRRQDTSRKNTQTSQEQRWCGEGDALDPPSSLHLLMLNSDPPIDSIRGPQASLYTLYFSQSSPERYRLRSCANTQHQQHQQCLSVLRCSRSSRAPIRDWDVGWSLEGDSQLFAVRQLHMQPSRLASNPCAGRSSLYMQPR